MYIKDNRLKWTKIPQSCKTNPPILIASKMTQSRQKYPYIHNLCLLLFSRKNIYSLKKIKKNTFNNQNLFFEYVLRMKR